MSPACCDRPMDITSYTPTGRPRYVCSVCGAKGKTKAIAPTEPEQPKRGRGRPRVHEDRQAEWKKRTAFEQSESRRKYKAEWIKRKRQQKEDSGNSV